MPNRAAVLKAPGVIQVQARPMPEPSDGELRLRVLRAGICGTDLALFSGSYQVPLPLVPGHEIVAVVDELGPGVTGITKGRRVVPEINCTCLAKGREQLCPACAMGLHHHCTQRSVLGIIRHDGGFSNTCIVPAGCVHPVPDSMSDAVAAFTEPVAAAFQAFQQVGSPGGKTVLVLGPGRLGTLIVAVARHLGARVAGVARSNASLQRARRWGAEETFQVDTTARQSRLRPRVLEWSGGLGADIVVEATGSPEQISVAMDLVRPRGTVVVKSTPGTPANVDLTALAVHEIHLVGSRCGPFPVALAWMETSDPPLESLVEHTLPLEQVEKALHLARSATKVALLP